MNRFFKINKKDVVFQDFDEETIIINLENGFYYSLGGGGTFIWKMIEGGVPLKDMESRLRTCYDGDDEEMIRSFRRTIDELEKEGLIVQDSDGSGASEEAFAEMLSLPLYAEKQVFKSPKLEKHTDMQDFLLVDPIHEIDYTDWPTKKM